MLISKIQNESNSQLLHHKYLLDNIQRQEINDIYMNLYKTNRES